MPRKVGLHSRSDRRNKNYLPAIKREYEGKEFLPPIKYKYQWVQWICVYRGHQITAS